MRRIWGRIYGWAGDDGRAGVEETSITIEIENWEEERQWGWGEDYVKNNIFFWRWLICSVRASIQTSYQMLLSWRWLICSVRASILALSNSWLLMFVL